MLYRIPPDEKEGQAHLVTDLQLLAVLETSFWKYLDEIVVPYAKEASKKYVGMQGPRVNSLSLVP